MDIEPNGNRACDLPQCAAEFIRQVARRMRWCRRVRQDVQAELTAHFEDALRDCATAEERDSKARELIEEFGDASLLAILCRRAKKRCRPLWIRVFVRTLQATGVFVLLFTPYTIWFVRGKPNPTIDYLAQLNALNRPSGPFEDNAWPHHEKAMRLIIEPNDTIQQSPWFKSLDSPEQPLAPQEQKVLGDWIAINILAWRQFEFATTKGHCRRTYRRLPGKPLLISCTDDPPLMNLRRLAQLAFWKSRLAVEQGQTDEAIGHCLTMLRAGGHWQTNAFLLEQLMGWMLNGTACKEIRRILKSGDLTDSQLLSLQTQLAKIYPDEYPHVNMEGERLIVLDGIQHEFTSGGIGGGHRVVGAYTGFAYVALEVPDIPENRSLGMVLMPFDVAASMIHGGRAKTTIQANRLYDRMSEMVRHSPHERRQRGIGEIMEGVGRMRKLRYALVYLLLPAERRVSEIRFQAKADYEALVTIVGVKRYRLEKGSYPPDLETLVDGGYLKEVPMDPFSDRPLVYGTTGDDFLLYSVGRDFRDDGGESGRDKDGRPTIWAESGDMVFWPVTGE